MPRTYPVDRGCCDEEKNFVAVNEVRDKFNLKPLF